MLGGVYESIQLFVRIKSFAFENGNISFSDIAHVRKTSIKTSDSFLSSRIII
jgi:hypothetical protein